MTARLFRRRIHGRAAVLAVMTFGILLDGGGALAKPRNCLTNVELSSDLIVRHGVYLREAADRCDPMQPGSKDEWKQFDQTFGTRLKGERTRRERAFKREFGDEWLQAVTTFDARMVTYDRSISFTEAGCEDVKSQLDDNKKGGWGSFVKQSKNRRDEAALDFKFCGQ